MAATISIYIDEGRWASTAPAASDRGVVVHLQKIVARFSGAYRCVALDHAGFGLSRVASDFGFTAEEHLRVIERFVQVRNLEEAKPAAVIRYRVQNPAEPPCNVVP
jgi:haloalkane dehalogenase